MQNWKNAAFWIVVQTGRTPLAIGEPGVAKTATIQAFGEATGRQVYFLVGSLRDPADIGGYPCEIDGVMHLAPPKWATDTRQDQWILVFEELTSNSSAVRAAMLRVIQENVVGDFILPANIWKLGLCNPAELAANGQELEPPVANRLFHHRWETDWDAWETGVMDGMKFPKPTFPVLPANWKTRIPACAALVSTFRKRRPVLFSLGTDSDGEIDGNGSKKVDSKSNGRSRTTGAWPSMRSWTNAIEAWAAGKSVGCGDDIEYQLIKGWVGAGPANEFFDWQRALDLPDPEELIREFCKDKPRYKHPKSADQVIAMMGSVNSAILGNLTEQRWLAGFKLIDAVADAGAMDVAAIASKPLCTVASDQERKPLINNRSIPPEFAKKFMKMLAKMG